MRVLAGVLCIGLATAFNAAASTFSTDATDLWYAAPAESESGWGVNVIQQGDTLFLTMFVHGPNSQPTWFVGSNTAFAGRSGDAVVFRGPLYATAGSPYSAPWSPGAFNIRPAGSVTFTLTTVNTATLSYTADGATVSKNLVRQTWKANDLSGQYIGGLAGTFSQCANPATNGFTLENANVAIVNTATNFDMDLENPLAGASCSYRGSYSQSGRLGSASGNFTCSGNVAGTFTASEIDGNATGFTLRLEERSSHCNYSGRLGGVRSTQ